jgi:hypothetical protein
MGLTSPQSSGAKKASQPSMELANQRNETLSAPAPPKLVKVGTILLYTYKLLYKNYIIYSTIYLFIFVCAFTIFNYLANYSTYGRGRIIARVQLQVLNMKDQKHQILRLFIKKKNLN